MKPICTLAAAASLAAFSVAAWAQQERQMPQLEREQQMQTQTDLGAASPLGDQRSANALIGMKVQNPSGEELGEVDDIILDDQQGRIAYALVSHGGVLGIGEKHYAVPWRAFTLNGEQLTLDIAKDRLESAPSFQKGELPDQSDPAFHEQVHEFYGIEPYELSEAEQEEQQRLAEAQEQDEAFEEQEEEGWNWKFWTSRGSGEDWARRLSEVIGTEVVDAQSETIGDIDDIVIDVREGRVTYALVGYGGMDMKTAAVPWNALELNEEQEQYALDATTEDLELAQISVDELDRLEDEQVSRTIHEAFDTEPYWLAYGYEEQQESGQETEQPMQQRQPQLQQRQQQGAQDMPRRMAGQQDAARPGQAQRMSEEPQFAQSSVSLSGTISSVEEFSLVETDTDQPGETEPLGVEQEDVGLHVQLDADTGETEILHISSAQALQDQNIDLSQGQDIEIEGFRTRYLGEPVIEVTQLTVDGQTVDLESALPEGAQEPRESI